MKAPSERKDFSLKQIKCVLSTEEKIYFTELHFLSVSVVGHKPFSERKLKVVFITEDARTCLDL